jgi:hypothetical protein
MEKKSFSQPGVPRDTKFSLRYLSKNQVDLWQIRLRSRAWELDTVEKPSFMYHNSLEKENQSLYVMPLTVDLPLHPNDPIMLLTTLLTGLRETGKFV